MSLARMSVTAIMALWLASAGYSEEDGPKQVSCEDQPAEAEVLDEQPYMLDNAIATEFDGYFFVGNQVGPCQIRSLGFRYVGFTCYRACPQCEWEGMPGMMACVERERDWIELVWVIPDGMTYEEAEYMLMSTDISGLEACLRVRPEAWREQWPEFPAGRCPRDTYWPCNAPVADANRDCKVNILDLIFVRNQMGKSPSGDPLYRQADVSGNGVVDLIDLLWVRNWLGRHCPDMEKDLDIECRQPSSMEAPDATDDGGATEDATEIEQEQ